MQGLAMLLCSQGEQNVTPENSCELYLPTGKWENLVSSEEATYELREKGFPPTTFCFAIAIISKYSTHSHNEPLCSHPEYLPLRGEGSICLVPWEGRGEQSLSLSARGTWVSWKRASYWLCSCLVHKITAVLSIISCHIHRTTEL